MPLVHPPAQRRASFATIALLTGALAAAALCSPLLAEGEYMVQDLGQRVIPPTLYVAGLGSAEISGVAYFYRDDGVHGFELWRSDGTALGTYMVRDVCPGICGSEGRDSVAALAAVGSHVFFAANDGVRGTELWVTDGSAAGTHRVADVRPGPRSSDPSALTSAQGLLFFVANDGVHGRDLWRSDGTESGTRRVVQSSPGPAVPNITAIAPGLGQLFLATETHDLWRSDGTEQGTFRLAEGILAPTPSWVKGVPFRTLPDGQLLFQGCPVYTDCELWASDGTPAGTRLLVDIAPDGAGSNPAGFYPIGNEIWFTAWVYDATSSRCALYHSDGTAAGTVPVPFPVGAECNGGVSVLADVVGARLFFTGWDPDHGAEPWVADGVSAQLVADVRPGPESSLLYSVGWDRPWFAALGTDLLFLADDGTNGWQLWRTDGTAAGTVPLSDFGGLPPDADFGFFQNLAQLPSTGNAILMTIFRPGSGVELWASDGSQAGTLPVAALDQQTSSVPRSTVSFWTYPEFHCLAALRQGVVLAALDTPGALAADLLFADGVPDNALSLAPIWDSESPLPPECTGNGNEVLAVGGAGATMELWRTRGVLPGLEPMRDISSNTQITRPLFHRFDGAAFLGVGSSVLRLDPEIDPTQILELPTALWWGSMASSSTALFLGGTDLEVTDGLEVPAVLLPEPPSPDWIQADDMTVAGERLFFSLDSPAEGPELWSSDGTTEGTAPVAILRPGPAGGLSRRETTEYWGNRVPESRIAALASGRVVFAGDDGTTGNELWTSNGTEAGTVLAADLDPGPDGSWPRHLTSLGDGVVLFAAEDPALGLELFRTDGTVAGTWMVRDIVAGASSSVPDDFAVEDGVLYFSAWTPAHGREMWRSDGTFAGTFRLTDIAPGPLSSSPSKFTRAGNRLFFLADDNVHGFELWARADDGSIPLFIDGFETADAARWSQVSP